MALKTKKPAARARVPARAGHKLAAPVMKSGEHLSAFEEMDLLFDRLSRGLLSRIGLLAPAEQGWPALVNALTVERSGARRIRVE